MTTDRVAAVDIGTNTVLLLVAEGAAENPRAVVERATITRLGEGVDRTRTLSAAAIARTVRCLAEYAAIVAEHGVSTVDMVCTSAARDAVNGAEFLAAVRATTGHVPRIVDGAEEARLAFEGTLSGLDLEGPVTVFDVGGGSTEVIHGELPRGAAPILRSSVSLNIGSVRLTERYVRHDPPLEVELRAVRSDVDRALERVPQFSTSTLVGVAGTVTTLSAIDRGLSTYDPSLVHGSTLSRAKIRAIIDRLAKLDADGRRAVTGLDPGRADVIVAGSLIALGVAESRGAAALVVSDRGVRWGLARNALGSGRKPRGKG